MKGFLPLQAEMLTIQFIPYTEIEGLTTEKRIAKLLNIVKENKIVLMEGRLERKEEAELIKKTMKQTNERFRGIEVSVIYPEEKSPDIFKKMKSSIASMLLGNRRGLTIIGPATTIQEIKREKQSIKLVTKNKRNKKGKGQGTR